MPETTPKYGLKKPLINETADISVLNENMDKIDTALSKKAEIVISSTIPPIPQREAGVMYFHVADSVPIPTGPDNIRVSPTMGIKIKE